jgi:hypothetical protein
VSEPAPSADDVKRLEAAVADARSRFERVAARALVVLDEARRQSADAHSRGTAAVRGNADAVRAAARDRSTARWRAAEAGLAEVLAPLSGSAAVAPWDATAWDALPSGIPPAVVRLGQARLRTTGNGARATVPVLAAGLGAGHVQIVAGEAQREAAAAMLGGVLLRLLAMAPPGDVRFRIFDPVGHGATLSAFGAFDRRRIAHGTPITTARAFDEALDALSAHANEVSTTYLKGDHPDLRSFLEAAGAGRQAYEVLCLLDAPQGLDGDLPVRVERLAAHAASRGITLLVHQDARSPRLDLGDDCATVELDGRGGARGTAFPGGTFAPDPPPEPGLVRRVAARAVPEAAAVPFDRMLTGERFAASSAAGLSVRIGEQGLDPIAVAFDDDTPHGLLAGDTGSGKSNLLRVLIYGLAHRYSPNELELYLLDFKEGVEFQEFAPAPGDPSFLPHAKVVSVNSSREFGVEVLEHVDRLTRRRYGMLGDARKLEDLRARDPGEPLPRVLLVIDEFQRIFEADDALSGDATAALLNIAKQGRAAGIHFLLATQSIGDVGTGTRAASRLEGVFKSARLRIGMRLSEQESREIFSTPANTAASDIHERGQAIVNPQGGHEDFNVKVRVAYLPDAVAARERREAVSRVVGMRRPPRVFDGGRGADAGANLDLRQAVKRRASPDGAVRTWLGAALRVDDDDPRSQVGLAVTLTPDAHRNIAVVGAGARTAAALLQWATIGLAATAADVRVVLVDTLREDDVRESGVPAGLARATRAAVETLGGQAEVLRPATVGELNAGLAEAREGAGARHVFVVFGVDRLDGMDDPLDPDDLYGPTNASTFADHLARGPRRGVHVLGWWSTASEFDRVLAAHANLGMRLYLRLPELVLSGHVGADVVVPDEPLAVWHDIGRGGAPEALQAYEPFGPEAVPRWLG